MKSKSGRSYQELELLSRSLSPFQDVVQLENQLARPMFSSHDPQGMHVIVMPREVAQLVFGPRLHVLWCL